VVSRAVARLTSSSRSWKLVAEITRLWQRKSISDMTSALLAAAAGTGKAQITFATINNAQWKRDLLWPITFCKVLLQRQERHQVHCSPYIEPQQSCSRLFSVPRFQLTINPEISSTRTFYNRLASSSSLQCATVFESVSISHVNVRFILITLALHRKLFMVQQKRS
jgi:hypothetical protein